jgi:hypothetical protein
MLSSSFGGWTCLVQSHRRILLQCRYSLYQRVSYWSGVGTVGCGWVSDTWRYQVFQQHHPKGRKNGSCPLLDLLARFLVFVTGTKEIVPLILWGIYDYIQPTPLPCQATLLHFGFDGFRLKIDENFWKNEVTLVLMLDYLRFSCPERSRCQAKEVIFVVGFFFPEPRTWARPPSL